MNDLCHIWMSHVIYEWGMSHINESCHIWMSHVIYASVMSHMNEACHIWTSEVIYEWGMSHMNEWGHIWMRHGTYKWAIWRVTWVMYAFLEPSASSEIYIRLPYEACQMASESPRICVWLPEEAWHIEEREAYMIWLSREAYQTRLWEMTHSYRGARDLYDMAVT